MRKEARGIVEDTLLRIFRKSKRNDQDEWLTADLLYILLDKKQIDTYPDLKIYLSKIVNGNTKKPAYRL